MFYRLSKHLEFRQKYSALRRIFNSLYSDETLSRSNLIVFDIEDITCPRVDMSFIIECSAQYRVEHENLR